jgi:hypothetical protein
MVTFCPLGVPEAVELQRMFADRQLGLVRRPGNRPVDRRKATFRGLGHPDLGGW